MNEKIKKYTIDSDLKDSIIKFLKNPFDHTIESIELLEKNNDFTDKEINQIITLLGKYPANLVYPIIDLFKINLKIKKVDSE